MATAVQLLFDPTMQSLVPFLFVLAVVFGVLELVNVFKNKAVSFMIALAIAFFAITYQPFLAFLWAQFGNITMFFIVMFFIAFTMELFGLRGRGEKEHRETMVIEGAILLILFGIGFSIIGALDLQLPFIGGGANLLYLIGFLTIVALFWSAFKEGLKETPQKG